MKKVFLVCVMCLAALTMYAQRNYAVLEFTAGSGVSQSEVDGIASVFSTAFNPTGYTPVNRLRVKEALKEIGFQYSYWTQNQKAYFGRMLNVSEVVVGTVNDVRGEYLVDVSFIDLESAVEYAKAGATIPMGSYRTSIENLAKKLATMVSQKMGTSTQTTTTTTTTTTTRRTEPYVIYDYLKVFPNDLGTFESVPTTVISNLNKQMKYGYGTWRVPTNEELALMRADNLIGGGTYMSTTNSRGILRLVTDKEKGKSVLDGYVDLGLPSGTQWKDKNESGVFYTYDEAVAKFSDNLPTQEQLEELKSSCRWQWTGSGYKVTGPNGNSIVLPAAGFRGCGGGTGYVGSYGYYWSSTPNGSSGAWGLGFDSSSVYVDSYDRCGGDSVRLVQD